MKVIPNESLPPCHRSWLASRLSQTLNEHPSRPRKYEKCFGLLERLAMTASVQPIHVARPRRVTMIQFIELTCPSKATNRGEAPRQRRVNRAAERLEVVTWLGV